MPFVERILEFITRETTPAVVGVILLVLVSIYAWFQHHRSKLLEQRLALNEERRHTLAEQLESKSPHPTLPIMPHLQGRVLIADDEASMCRYLTMLIREKFAGVSAVSVADGKEAIEYLSQNQPSLLILDLVMPVVSGYDVIKELWARRSELPILVISAYAGSKDEVAARAKVPSDRLEFLAKPFSPDELLRIVQAMLSKQAKQKD